MSIFYSEWIRDPCEAAKNRRRNERQETKCQLRYYRKYRCYYFQLYFLDVGLNKYGFSFGFLYFSSSLTAEP